MIAGFFLCMMKNEFKDITELWYFFRYRTATNLYSRLKCYEKITLSVIPICVVILTQAQNKLKKVSMQTHLRLINKYE